MCVARVAMYSLDIKNDTKIMVKSSCDIHSQFQKH